ncbi:hypothetical protein CRG98_004677 [Punica granatum]|uniref:Uncharacterized protein n=1 Tax=Punica granatum TaxID=22663 RepID=A0A2I0L2J5_PUNGR|nr:hypothetical protein CRG98_004677 [Punica granatum]
MMGSAAGRGAAAETLQPSLFPGPQDLLGYDQPSKTVEWLIDAASESILQLSSLKSSFAGAAEQLSDKNKSMSVGEDESRPESFNVDLNDDPNRLDCPNPDQQQCISCSESACSTGHPLQRSSLTIPEETSRGESALLRLEFVNKLCATIFTGSYLVDEENNPIKLRLLDERTNKTVSADPLSSERIEIVVLDGPLKKGPWSVEEDTKLTNYIKRFGIWSWNHMPKAAGLKRSGKSCRLRWMNYLRPNIRRGKFSEDEQEVIIKLHQQLGNRWSAIAGHLPGRTDAEIKNIWNTHLKKRVLQTEKDSPVMFDPLSSIRLQLMNPQDRCSEGIDIEPIPLEVQLQSDLDNPCKETDSCYSDSDSEDGMVARARQKYRKLTVSESFQEDIHFVEATTQSGPFAASDEGCMQVEMSSDANIGHTENHDTLSWELFYQNAGEVVLSMEIQTIAKEIVRACARDSRSLALMARALSNVSDTETWEYALNSLSMQHASCRDDYENLSVNVLKFCIELLDDDVTRKCLKSLAMQRKSKVVGRTSMMDSWIGDDIGQHLVDLVFHPEEGYEFLMQGGLGLVEPPEVEEWERAKEIYIRRKEKKETFDKKAVLERVKIHLPKPMNISTGDEVANEFEEREGEDTENSRQWSWDLATSHEWWWTVIGPLPPEIDGGKVGGR